MLQFYRKLHPAGRLGLLGLPLFVLVIVLLVVDLREPEVPNASDFTGLHALHSSAGLHQVQVGAPITGAPKNSSFRPISSTARSQVLQRLKELRAKYKQMGLGIGVHADIENPGLQKVAQQLNNLLGMYGLGAFDAKETRLSGLDVPAVLFHAPNEVSIAFEFLSSVSPYLHTQVTVIETQQISNGRLQLYLLAAPSFADDGTVILD